MNNQEPTRECCEKCRAYARTNEDLTSYVVPTCIDKQCPFCHSIKPPVEGDFRWKDTKEKVKGEVLAKDYENWLEKNAHNLECWTGEEWKSLVSPELSWGERFDKEMANFPVNTSYVFFEGLNGEKVPTARYSKIKEFISQELKKVEQQAVQQYAKEMFYKMKDFEKAHFNSGRASMVEWCVKKIEEMKVEELNSHWLYLVKPEQAFIKALDDILQALKNKETKE